MNWTPHPYFKPPTQEQVKGLILNPDGSQNEEGLRKLYEIWEAREEAIKASKEDPLRYGVELESWKRIRWGLEKYDEVLVLGGNRAAKTTGMAKLAMEAVTTLFDGHIVMFSQNADTSVKVQQASMWEMMPKEFKRKTKSIEGYINFSMQNGFTGQSFIFPDTRTRVDFKTYTQFSNNHTILEGFEFGFPDVGNHKLNIGIFNDEYLGDESLIKTQRFRLATRNGKLVTGFTPIDGYTPLIADYCKGAQTVETKPAVLLDNEAVPVKQISTTRDAAIVYLHSEENPFGGYERIAKDLKNRPRDEILVRAYGVPVKSMTSLFPKFSTNVNVLSYSKNQYGFSFPRFKDMDKAERERDWTFYMVVDPAGNRNWTAIWAGVNNLGDVYIAREWPDRPSFGEWALFGDPRWRKGPATKKIGYDVKGYAELFKELESDLGITVYERIGDSRYFARENSDNIDLFSDFDAIGMHFIPSDGRTEDIGISALDEWFDYNQDRDIDGANKPRCFIHEDCGNLIESLLSYNQAGKADEALKDFIDLIRYLRMANGGVGPDHVGAGGRQITRRGKGGY